jgi:hypothetical protein
MEKNKFVFNLSEELEYSKAGNFVKTASLELRAPGMNEYDESMDLAQGIMSALVEISKGQALSEDAVQKAREMLETDSNKMTGGEIIPALLSSRTVKFKDTAKCFRKLLVLVGTTDGEVLLTEDLINGLNPQDFTNLLGEYAANFIVPSLI